MNKIMMYSAKINNLKKAAIILLNLSNDNLKDIFKDMDNKTVSLVTKEMLLIKDLPGSILISVINEFYSCLNNPTNISYNIEDTKRTLNKVLDTSNFACIEHYKSAKIVNNNDYHNLEDLKEYVYKQEPKIIAFIILKLIPYYASQLLLGMKEELSNKVISDIVKINKIDSNIKVNVNKTLETNFLGILNMKQDINLCDFFLDMFKFMNEIYFKKYISIITKCNNELGKELKNKMFVFDDILNLTCESIRILVNKVDRLILLNSLKGASDDVRNYIFSYTPRSIVNFFVNEMENVNLIKVKKVKEAQYVLVSIIKDMLSKGEIIQYNNRS